MSIQKKHEELIESSYKELEILKNEVTQLEDIRKNIETLIGNNIELPKLFEEKFKKIIKLSDDYTNTLGAATKNYLDGNNTLFTTKLSELSAKIKEFEKEITRLVNTDFTILFKDLQKVFIEQIRADLAMELKKFEEKSKDLQTKIDELKRQIERLEKIDIEKHFDKFQKTLSEIFGAINSINITITNIIQTLTGIIQSLGNIQTTLDTNHKEVKQLINSFSETIEEHLADQDKQATKNVELLESNLKFLSEQNELLKKEVKTNRIIQIVGLTLISILLIYIAATKS
jgi:DNA repair ATPase RecN